MKFCRIEGYLISLKTLIYYTAGAQRGKGQIKDEV